MKSVSSCSGPLPVSLSRTRMVTSHILCRSSCGSWTSYLSIQERGWRSPLRRSTIRLKSSSELLKSQPCRRAIGLAHSRGLDGVNTELANAVKILPAFAIQSDLMTQDGSGRFILTEAGRRAIGRAVITTRPVRPTSRRPARRRTTSIATNDPRQVGRSRRLLATDRRALTPEAQAIAAELLYERTERHQALVRAVAARCGRGEFYEDAAAYDLLIDLDTDIPLILMNEVKQLLQGRCHPGSRRDRPASVLSVFFSSASFPSP